MSSVSMHKSITYYMRILHRDLGYLALGLTLVFALSGVILIYRGTDFLKSPVSVETTLPQQMSAPDLAGKLHVRRLEVTKTEGEVIHFQDGANLRDGVYNRETGEASFIRKQFPDFVERCLRIHMINNSKAFHIIFVVYGFLLVFLALSSLWMYKPGTRNFRRGLLLSCSGVVLTVAMIVIV